MQQELNNRSKAKKIKWFTPNGKQEDFINAVGAGDVFICVFSAANGVGKTALAMNVLGNIVYGQSQTENPWFKHPIFEHFPYPKRGRIASSRKNVEQIGAIQTEIKAWWPEGTYQTSRLGKAYDSQYVINDWVVDIMTYEQDVTQYESATLGVLLFDEPPPINILNASIARMRAGGIIMIFMTPLDEGGEILEDLEEREEYVVDGQVCGRVRVIYADIEDNCQTHGIRGHLEHKNIVQMVSFYNDDEREARAKGKPSHLTGRIYTAFEDKDPFVVDDFVPDKAWPRVQIVDPHDGIPMAVTWAALDFTGQIWIYDEFPYNDIDKYTTTDLTFPDYRDIFNRHEGRIKIFERIIDPYFGNKRYGNTGLTPKGEFAEIGFDYVDGDTSGIEVGHGRVREFLKYDKNLPVSALNHPKLHILKKCRNHKRAMLRYKKKINRSGEVRDKIQIEETYKHFADNIRHLCMKYDDIIEAWKTQQTQKDDMTQGMMGGGRGGW